MGGNFEIDESLQKFNLQNKITINRLSRFLEGALYKYPECIRNELIVNFINSFIADIYIAPLQVGLLRSATNPSAAE